MITAALTVTPNDPGSRLRRDHHKQTAHKKETPTMKIHRSAPAALAVGLALGAGSAAGQDTPATGLTIYSTARPGAIAPELYRSGGRGQAVPGYAVVRQQRR